MQIPVLIISFNNHDFVANTIAQLRTLGVQDILVVDNASNWDETQAYLDTLAGQGVRLIRNPENHGHLCWARPEIYDLMPDKFCITDPDLQFNPKLPRNFIEVLCELSDRYQANKVGFALDISDSDEMFQYPDYHPGHTIAEWESQHWKHRLPGEALEIYLAEVDTTFHVFNKNGQKRRQLRVAGDYTAKHLPWYRSNPLIPTERMTEIYRQATQVSTTARFHMRYHLQGEAEPAPRELAVHLYQIAYSPETLAAVEPGYLVLDNLANERPDWYEYWPIRNFLLHNALDDDAFYGFFSPKFRSKTGLTHAQVQDFVRQHADKHDIFLFSPQPDMGSLFLNVFEQGEVFDKGLIAATEAVMLRIGWAHPPLGSLVMDSTQTVFSNYFVARPAFWKRWLELTEELFEICEGPPSPARDLCTAPTSYDGVQRKVFVQERLASLLLTLEPRWRSMAANTFQFAWSGTPLNQLKNEAVASDALKMAFRMQGHPEYLAAFGWLREQWRKGHSGG